MAMAPERDDERHLPDWPAGSVALLSTTDERGAPHAIPVSTALRGGDALVVLALGARRGSLQRLRARPAVALALLSAGDVAFTAHGRASVFADPLDGLEGVAGVRIDVEQLRSHRRPTFVIDAPVGWHWADDAARERDVAVRAALLAYAESR